MSVVIHPGASNVISEVSAIELPVSRKVAEQLVRALVCMEIADCVETITLKVSPSSGVRHSPALDIADSVITRVNVSMTARVNDTERETVTNRPWWRFW